MIFALLVVLAVFMVGEVLVYRARRVVTPTVRVAWDGTILTPSQILSRVLLRDVQWLWTYGVLPPRPYTLRGKTVTAARILLAAASLTLFTIAYPALGAVALILVVAAFRPRKS